jgi:hypothetical protein
VNSLTVKILLQKLAITVTVRQPAVLQPNLRSGTFASGKSRAGRDHPGARSTEYRTGKDFCGPARLRCPRLPNSAHQRSEPREPERSEESEFLANNFSSAWTLFFGPNSVPNSGRIPPIES